MHIENRTASLAFKTAIAVIGTVALADAAGLFGGAYDTQFHYFFTNISNVAVVAYFWCTIVAIARGHNAHEPWHPKVKYMLMLGITVTCLVAHFMLEGGMVFVDGVFNPQMLAVHYIVPIATIADWLLFDEKGHMSWTDPLTWPAFPIVYLIYINILVLGFGVRVTAGNRWPYPFLNADALGVPTVCGIIVALLVIFIALGEVYVLIDKQLAKRRSAR